MEKGTVCILSPLPTENEPISVGNLSAVGRNLMLQTIVDSLSYSNSSTTRLVHIYGAQGTGKSFIAKHAAKYLFERRNFDYGCIYVELKNKYAVGENLSSLICKTLGIDTANKETLCNYINRSKLLIILDKSSKISRLDPLMLNRTIEFFLECTEQPKFIIITDYKEDITIQNTMQFEVDELEPRDAARLLLLCANQYIEETNKNLDVLSTHEIFNLISRNPSNIMRFSQYLRSYPNTLDEIVVEQKAQLQLIGTSRNRRDDDIEVQVGEETSWVIKQSYEHLYKTHSDYIMVLFILCQVPNGLFESDIELI